MPRAMSDQPGMTASNCPPSMTATPSPSSNHSARSVLTSSGGRPFRCLVCAAGISGAWPAFSRDRSALCGAGSWLAIHAAPSTAPASCRYAAVVAPSYSTTSRRLPYGLSLSSTVPGWPANAADRGPRGPLRIEDMPEIYQCGRRLMFRTYQTPLRRPWGSRAIGRGGCGMRRGRGAGGGFLAEVAVNPLRNAIYVCPRPQDGAAGSAGWLQDWEASQRPECLGG